ESRKSTRLRKHTSLSLIRWMNEIYTFTGELINDHLGQHDAESNNSSQVQPYCSFCFPPPREFTLPFRRFWLWIELAGACAYNRITQQTFDELISYDYGEVHPSIIRQRITRAFEQNIHIDQEDEEFSDDHYSETVDTETQTQKDYPRNGSEESIIYEENPQHNNGCHDERNPRTNPRPNMENQSTNNGLTQNNDTNAALLAQIQELTNALQQQNSSNSLLGIHGSLAGEKKSRQDHRYNPLNKKHHTRSTVNENEEVEEEVIIGDDDMEKAGPECSPTRIGKRKPREVSMITDPLEQTAEQAGEITTETRHDTWYEQCDEAQKIIEDTMQEEITPTVDLIEIEKMFEEIFHFLLDAQKEIEEMEFLNESDNKYESYTKLLNNYYPCNDNEKEQTISKIPIHEE
ncbi:2677_t:CDS:2, partial [Ambispora gerdemannii]